MTKLEITTRIEIHKHRKQCNLLFIFKIKKQKCGNYRVICCPHFPTLTLKLSPDLTFKLKRGGIFTTGKKKLHKDIACYFIQNNCAPFKFFFHFPLNQTTLSSSNKTNCTTKYSFKFSSYHREKERQCSSTFTALIMCILCTK